METPVELKTCEACGVIYTRPVTEESPYCARCEAILSDFPSTVDRAQRGRPRIDAEHGTYRKWHHGCRCVECKAAYKAYNHKRWEKRKAEAK